MTGQLALPFADPIPVVDVGQRGKVTVRRMQSSRLRRDYMWWRGRRRRVANVPVADGVL